MSRARVAVFPVAGYGSRFLPATKSVPKAMLPVLDKPLVQYAVEEARGAGIDHFVFVTGDNREVIAQHFEDDADLGELLKARGQLEELAAVEAASLEPGQAAYVKQPKALGLGNAVWCARHMIGAEPFVVILPDVFLLDTGTMLRAMIDLQAEAGGNVVAVAEVPEEDVDRFGILDAVDPDRRPAVATRGVVEKPAAGTAPSNLGIIGRYVLEPAILDALGALPAGAGGEVQLTDALAALMPAAPLTGYVTDAQFFDCGDRVGMLAANIAAGLRHPDLAARVAHLLGDHGASAAPR